MNNREKYAEVFCTVFGVDESVLNEDFTFSNIDKWDSVAHLSLISELEDTFNIMFETEDILHYKSYLNGIKILEKYGIHF